MKGKEKSCDTCTNELCSSNKSKKQLRFGGGSTCFICNKMFLWEDLEKLENKTKCPKCGNRLCPQR